MAAAMKVPEGRYKLKLGRSFDKKPKTKPTYQTIRYDFKPASVEDSKESYAEFGPANDAFVSIPKLDANGEVKDVTIFQGSRKPCQKECLLIYDHETGEFTLEEVKSNVHLKQVRSGEDGKEKNLQYVRDIRKKFVKSNVEPRASNSVQQQQQQRKMPKDDAIMSDHSGSSEGEVSDDDQSNSDETGSEDDKDDIAKSLEAELNGSNLKADLHLSDDSDDDE